MPEDKSLEGLTEDELAHLIESSEAKPLEDGTTHAARAARELEEGFAKAAAARHHPVVADDPDVDAQ